VVVEKDTCRVVVETYTCKLVEEETCTYKPVVVEICTYKLVVVETCTCKLVVVVKGSDKDGWVVSIVVVVVSGGSKGLVEEMDRGSYQQRFEMASLETLMPTQE